MRPELQTMAAVVIALALARAPAALAGEENIEEVSMEDLLNQPVETTSRRALPLAWAPADTIVVTEDQIRERHYLSLKDLLRDLPEVNLYDNFYEASRELFSIRGSPGNDTFLILQDGVQISSATGELAPLGESYPLFDARRVEISLGPASALYGADAFTGVVNIITREAVHDREARAAAVYGTDQYKHVAASGQVSLFDGLKLRVSGHWQDADNPNLAEKYPGDFTVGPVRDPFTGQVVPGVENARYSNHTASSSVSATATFDDKLTLAYDTRTYRMMTGASERPEYTVYGAEARYHWQVTSASYATYLLPRLKSQSLLSYSIFEEEPSFEYQNAYTGFRPAYKYAATQSFAGNEQLSYAFTEAQNALVGISWARIHSAPESGDLLDRPVDPASPPASQGYVLPGTSLPMPFYELSYKELGAYAQWQSQWNLSVSTTLGVRWDYDERYGGAFSPRAGVVFQPSAGNTFKLLYGQGFAPPSPTRQYAFWGEFTGTTASGAPLAPWYHVPNEALRPMASRALEIDYTGLWGKALLVNADAYYSLVDHITLLVQHADGIAFAGGWAASYERNESVGSARLYGGSVSLRYQVALGPVQVEPWASYSLSLGEMTEGEAAVPVELPLNTPQLIKGGLTVRCGAVSFTPRVRIASESTHSSFQPGQAALRAKVPGSTVFDATLRADDVGLRGLSVTLDARNALDARYYAPGSASLANFVANPQDTRQLMAEISYALH